MKKAHILSVGNELLIGDTVNTNASWIGSVLTEWGFYVERVFTIPDHYELIKEQVDYSLRQADLTIVTGGLGPTHDDITRKAVADLFDVGMVKNDAVLDHIKKIFEKRGFQMSPSNVDQAMVPENCKVLYNAQGTAPGLWFERERHILVVLPGVPYEMKFLMQKKVKPGIAEMFPERDFWATEYFRTAGISESRLSDEIGDLTEFVQNGVGVAYLPAPGGVTIRISASGSDMKSAEKKLTLLQKKLYEKAGETIYGRGKTVSLAGVVGEILVKRNLRLAVAESCTGGALANTITDIPGSSRYMVGGTIAYANRIKTEQLGVSEEDLESVGAVSKKVALQMAKGAAERFGAEIGVSATGIAGPGGGTTNKPVGTVWMGFWIVGSHFALNTIFTNNRRINKERTVMVVLESLRRQLLGIDTMPYELNPHRS